VEALLLLVQASLVLTLQLAYLPKVSSSSQETGQIGMQTTDLQLVVVGFRSPGSRQRTVRKTDELP
jgi:hypothetical protein